MELNKTLKTARSWSYIQGFKKGIEISNNNHLEHGYFADEENEMTVRVFQKQINEGLDKFGNKLTHNQIQLRKGIIDGIKHKNGTGYCFKESSPFEQRLNRHDYGEKKPYNGTNYWE